jgi:hypothetical protein
MVSNRLNEVIKRLTVIATVGLPLTVVTSYYGMNFEFGEYHMKHPHVFILTVLGAERARHAVVPAQAALGLSAQGAYRPQTKNAPGGAPSRSTTCGGRGSVPTSVREGTAWAGDPHTPAVPSPCTFVVPAVHLARPPI